MSPEQKNKLNELYEYFIVDNAINRQLSNNDETVKINVRRLRELYIEVFNKRLTGCNCTRTLLKGLRQLKIESEKK